MRIQASDERDNSWEDRPRFRVYFFRAGESPDRRTGAEVSARG